MATLLIATLLIVLQDLTASTTVDERGVAFRWGLQRTTVPRERITSVTVREIGAFTSIATTPALVTTDGDVLVRGLMDTYDASWRRARLMSETLGVPIVIAD